MIARSVTTVAGQTIVRYKLRSVRGWRAALHVVHAPDTGAWHDHYWDSWSMVLLGGLAEAVDGGTRQLRPGSLRRRPHRQRHRVRGYAVTLVLTSPRRQASSAWVKGLGRPPQRFGGRR